MAWIPEGASPELEKEMEAKELPESDRDELRRFAEVIGRIKDKREGKPLPPAPDGMKQWMGGKQ